MTADREVFFYGEDHLTAGKALALARNELTGSISESTRDKINRSAERVQKIVAEGKPVYGINTGFGPLCTTAISAENTQILQENILKSHSVGVGRPIQSELAKLMLILKVHTLAKGFSGIQLKTLLRIIWHIENNLIPVVPSKGSVGASGDLAPLAHAFLPLIGLGKIDAAGEVFTTKDVLDKHKLEPLQLGPKEGLALINGTQFIAAHAIRVLEQLQRCLDHADIIAAMMLEGLQGSLKPFDQELHKLRPFRGTQHVAARIRSLLQDSEIIEDHIDCERVQDP